MCWGCLFTSLQGLRILEKITKVKMIYLKGIHKYVRYVPALWYGPPRWALLYSWGGWIWPFAMTTYSCYFPTASSRADFNTLHIRKSPYGYKRVTKKAIRDFSTSRNIVLFGVWKFRANVFLNISFSTHKRTSQGSNGSLVNRSYKGPIIKSIGGSKHFTGGTVHRRWLANETA